MKRENKKLLSITAVGLSAWLLVAALVLFDNSSQAMLRNDPVPANESAAASTDEPEPRTLGTTTEENHLRSAPDRSMPAGNEAVQTTMLQAPATTLAHDGHHHDDDTAQALASEFAAPKKDNSLPVIAASVGGALLVLGAITTAVYFRTKKTSVKSQQSS